LLVKLVESFVKISLLPFAQKVSYYTTEVANQWFFRLQIRADRRKLPPRLRALLQRKPLVWNYQTRFAWTR